MRRYCTARLIIGSALVMLIAIFAADVLARNPGALAFHLATTILGCLAGRYL